MTVRRGARGRGRGAQAAVGVLRAARIGRHRRAREGRRGRTRGRALVLLDAKRGDIGSTMQGYAEAYLDQDVAAGRRRDDGEPLPRASSRCGRCSTRLRRTARACSCSALTSNPEGPQVQHARDATGTVAGRSSPRSPRRTPAPPRWARSAPSSGPTCADCTEDLAVNGPLLAPGFGAQGGRSDDVRADLCRRGGECVAQHLARRARGRARSRRAAQGRPAQCRVGAGPPDDLTAC